MKNIVLKGNRQASNNEKTNHFDSRSSDTYDTYDVLTPLPWDERSHDVQGRNLGMKRHRILAQLFDSVDFNPMTSGESLAQIIKNIVHTTSEDILSVG